MTVRKKSYSLGLNKNNVYTLRLKVNKELQPYFHRKEIYRSLRTKEIDEAKLKASIIVNKYNDLLKVCGMLNEQQREEIVNDFIYETLKQDRIDRANSPRFGWRNEYDEQDELLQDFIGEYRRGLGENDYSEMYQTADSLLKERGLIVVKGSNINDGTEIGFKNIEYKLFLQDLLMANIEILKEMYNRNRGNFNRKYNAQSSSQFKTTSENKKIITFGEAIKTFEAWYLQQDRDEKSVKLTMNRIFNVIEPYFGSNTDTASIGNVETTAFRKFLATYPNTSRQVYKALSFNQIKDLIDNNKIPKKDLIGISTVNKYTKVLKQLFKFFMDEGLISKNPTLRLELHKESMSSLVPFSVEQMKEIFNELDNPSPKARRNPLYKEIFYILAYTGMRPNELWKTEIRDENGIVYFDLTMDEIDLKTETSKRKIPLHSKLLEMGISNEILQQIKTVSQDAVSKAFNQDILPRITNRVTKQKLYALRHTLATQLKHKDIDKDKVSEILGHSKEGTNVTDMHYQGKYTLQQLKDAIDQLEY